MASFAIGAICIWLIISATFYTALLLAFIGRFGTLGISLFNLGLSAILSPGILAGGHGAIPFPGGISFLLGGLGTGLIATANFSMWMLTFLIFSACSWVSRKYRGQ